MRITRFIVVSLLTVLVVVLTLADTVEGHADNRSLVWTRWDVAISQIDTTNNVFHVTETHQLNILTGPYNGGDREIPLGRMTDIRNAQVFDGDTPLKQVQSTVNDCPTTTGIVCVWRSDEQLVLYWNFIKQVQSGQTRTIRYEYDVFGALRSYPAGDQLFWKALADNRPFPVLASQVTIELPADLKPQKYTTYPANWIFSQGDNNTLIFNSPGNLGTSDNVEVRFQYPHNPAMAPPPWQAAYDNSIRSAVTMPPPSDSPSIAIASVTVFAVLFTFLLVLWTYRPS